ncbi:hypothetical protein NECAME_18565, partial [Necator americanus]
HAAQGGRHAAGGRTVDRHLLDAVGGTRHRVSRHAGRKRRLRAGAAQGAARARHHGARHRDDAHAARAERARGPDRVPADGRVRLREPRQRVSRDSLAQPRADRGHAAVFHRAAAHGRHRHGRRRRAARGRQLGRAWPVGRRLPADARDRHRDFRHGNGGADGARGACDGGAPACVAVSVRNDDGGCRVGGLYVAGLDTRECARQHGWRLSVPGIFHGGFAGCPRGARDHRNAGTAHLAGFPALARGKAGHPFARH